MAARSCRHPATPTTPSNSSSSLQLNAKELLQTLDGLTVLYRSSENWRRYFRREYQRLRQFEAEALDTRGATQEDDSWLDSGAEEARNDPHSDIFLSTILRGFRRQEGSICDCCAVQLVEIDEKHSPKYSESAKEAVVPIDDAELADLLREKISPRRDVGGLGLLHMTLPSTSNLNSTSSPSNSNFKPKSKSKFNSKSKSSPHSQSPRIRTNRSWSLHTVIVEFFDVLFNVLRVPLRFRGPAYWFSLLVLVIVLLIVIGAWLIPIIIEYVFKQVVGFLLSYPWQFVLWACGWTVFPFWERFTTGATVGWDVGWTWGTANTTTAGTALRNANMSIIIGGPISIASSLVAGVISVIISATTSTVEAGGDLLDPPVIAPAPEIGTPDIVAPLRATLDEILRLTKLSTAAVPLTRVLQLTKSKVRGSGAAVRISSLSETSREELANRYDTLEKGLDICTEGLSRFWIELQSLLTESNIRFSSFVFSVEQVIKSDSGFSIVLSPGPKTVSSTPPLFPFNLVPLNLRGDSTPTPTPTIEQQGRRLIATLRDLRSNADYLLTCVSKLISTIEISKGRLVDVGSEWAGIQYHLGRLQAEFRAEREEEVVYAEEMHTWRAWKAYQESCWFGGRWCGLPRVPMVSTRPSRPGDISGKVIRGIGRNLADLGDVMRNSQGVNIGLDGAQGILREVQRDLETLGKQLNMVLTRYSSDDKQGYGMDFESKSRVYDGADGANGDVEWRQRRVRNIWYQVILQFEGLKEAVGALKIAGVGLREDEKVLEEFVQKAVWECKPELQQSETWDTCILRKVEQRKGDKRQMR